MPTSGTADQAPPEIVIVGGGWAGLSTAIELTQQGQRCIVLESARQIGGRARSIELEGIPYDNGQHLFLGAYHNLKHVLDILALPEQELFHRFPLSLNLIAVDHSTVCLKSGNMPAPLHLLAGFIKARGLNTREKISVVRLWLYLVITRFRLQQDYPLLEFLRKHHQSDKLINSIWNPLCTAALNTPAERASTQIFIEVLRCAFTGSKNNSDLLLARKTLGEILPEPARAFLQDRGSVVQCMSRVQKINVRNGKIVSIETNSGTRPVSSLVLATPFHITRRLLQGVDGCEALVSRMDALEYEPISTLYLQYPLPLLLDEPMLGVIGGTTQWLFDRRYTGQPGTLSVVISAHGPHEQLERQVLIDHVIAEIGQLFPDWPAPIHSYLVQEKQAAFSCTVDAQDYRPGPDTPIDNCYLAGDYIKSLLPATLETAVWSGLQCARRILAYNREQAS